MEQSLEKNYVLLSVNMNDVEKTEPMTWEEVTQRAFTIAQDQPVKYFNGDCRLKVANLKEGTVRAVGIKLFIKSKMDG
jgi:hypothetical protein